MSDTRIRSILTSADGRAMPALAEHIAYETELSAEESVQMLAAAKADRGTSNKGERGPARDTPLQPTASTTFTELRETGALGLNEPPHPGAKALAKSAWGAAVKAANGETGKNWADA